jgi:hypothetical protein
VNLYRLFTPSSHLGPFNNAIDLAKQAFLQINREHKQEWDKRNLKLQLNMKLMNLIESSSLDLKEIVDTGE